MENKSVTLAAQVLVPAVSEIRSLLEASRKNVAQQVNHGTVVNLIGRLVRSLFVVNKMTASVLHMVKRPYRSFPGR